MRSFWCGEFSWPCSLFHIHVSEFMHLKMYSVFLKYSNVQQKVNFLAGSSCKRSNRSFDLDLKHDLNIFRDLFIVRL